MKKWPLFNQLNNKSSFLLLLLIILISGLLFSSLSLLLGWVIWGKEMIYTTITSEASATTIHYLKLTQFINQLGIMLVPALLFVSLTEKSPTQFLKVNKKPALNTVLFSIVTIVIALPLVGWLAELNNNITLPWERVMHYVTLMEDQATVITNLFLSTSSIIGLIVNIILIAIIPAIAEEILFRGIILQKINAFAHNDHIAVWVTAIIFSAIHLQFFGFIPRLFLGVLLGYIFILSHNIWVPIVVHFANNALSVFVAWLYSRGIIETPMDEFGTSTDIKVVIACSVFTIALLLHINTQEKRKRDHKYGKEK